MSKCIYEGMHKSHECQKHPIIGVQNEKDIILISHSKVKHVLNQHNRLCLKNQKNQPYTNQPSQFITQNQISIFSKLFSFKKTFPPHHFLLHIFCQWVFFSLSTFFSFPSFNFSLLPFNLFNFFLSSSQTSLNMCFFLCS